MLLGREEEKCSHPSISPSFLTWQVRAIAFLLCITISSSSWVLLSIFHHLCNKYSIPTVSGSEREDGDLKKNRIMHFFHQKFLLFPYLKVSSSEPLERWATMWPHSEHLVTIWNTPTVDWGRWIWEKKRFVLFMILGLVAIRISPFMSTPRYGPHMRRGLSAALESYSLLLFASLCTSLGNSEEQK